MQNRKKIPYSVKTTTTRQVVISRHFDTGDSYSIGQTALPDEYNIRGPRRPEEDHSIDARMSRPHSVAPIREAELNTDMPAIATDPGEAPVSSSPAAETVPEGKVPEVDVLPPPGNPAIEEELPQQAAAQAVARTTGETEPSKDDDEFMADMMAILQGKKNVPQQEPEEQAKMPDSLPKANQHDIFDQIANSMQYANAYNMGDIDLEQRFDQFDKMESHFSSPKSEKTYKTTETDRVPQADHTDFINDMDLIAQSPGQPLPLSPPDAVGGTIRPGDPPPEAAPVSRDRT